MIRDPRSTDGERKKMQIAALIIYFAMGNAKSPQRHVYHCQRIAFGFLILMMFEFAVNVPSVMGFTSLPPFPSFGIASQKENNWKQSSRKFSGSPGMSTLSIHHTALKTRNITTAIEFYSLFGYQVACRFRAGPARAAWLELMSSSNDRLELIEVPGYVLQEEPGTRAKVMDLMQRPEILGYNHVALDVTQQIKHDRFSSLNEWLDQLNRTSMERFQRSLRIALTPRQQIIGRGIYELAFLYDADGSLVELLHKQGERSQELESGWKPWDGEGFVGKITMLK